MEKYRFLRLGSLYFPHIWGEWKSWNVPLSSFEKLATSQLNVSCCTNQRKVQNGWLSRGMWTYYTESKRRPLHILGPHGSQHGMKTKHCLRNSSYLSLLVANLVHLFQFCHLLRNRTSKSLTKVLSQNEVRRSNSNYYRHILNAEPQITFLAPSGALVFIMV